MTAILEWAPDRDAALADAQRRARQALTLDPGHAHAWTVLAGVAFARGHADECQADASRAIELSPSHPSILYGSGVLLALSGAWERGLECIRESNRLNPYHPGTSTFIWPSTGSRPAITPGCSLRPASSPTPRTSGAP